MLHSARALALLGALYCKVQRRVPLGVLRVYDRAEREQVHDGGLGAGVARPVQRRRVLAVARVDVEPLPLQEHDAGRLVALRAHVHQVDVVVVSHVDVAAQVHQVANYGEVSVEGGEVQSGEAFLALGPPVDPLAKFCLFLFKRESTLSVLLPEENLTSTTVTKKDVLSCFNVSLPARRVAS